MWRVGRQRGGLRVGNGIVNRNLSARKIRTRSLAAALGLPVVLRTPHAAADKALAIVRHCVPPGAAFHWHKGSRDTSAAICDAGYFVS